MSDDNTMHPTHRVSFATKTVRDGQEQLGRPVEIGAVWPRRDPEKKGGILRFDVIPENIREGVIFVTENERERQQTQESGRGDRFERASRDIESTPRSRGRSR